MDEIFNICICYLRANPKIILIDKGNYIDNQKVVVDQDEYNEVQKKLVQIVTEVVAYIEDYIGHITGTVPMHPRQFARKYQYSTLPYFHDILMSWNAKSEDSVSLCSLNSRMSIDNQRVRLS